MSRRAFALALGLASCASPPTGTRDGGVVDAVRDGGAEAPCTRPLAERAPGAVCVRYVRGQVTDLEGLPRGDIPVTVCGPTCWVGRSDAAGRFSVEVGDFIPLAIYSVLAHGRPDYATSYVPMPDTVGPGDVVTIASPMRVPRYTVTGEVVARGTARAGEFAVTVPADAQLEFDLEDFKLGELGTRLRAAQVPLDRAPPFAAEGGVSAVWALAPFKLVSTRPMGLRLPNATNLAAGTAVDFVIMGWDLLPPVSNAGRAVVAARGRVRADGAAIETDPGEGVPVLTWVGVRARRSGP